MGSARFQRAAIGISADRIKPQQDAAAARKMRALPRASSLSCGAHRAHAGLRLRREIYEPDDSRDVNSTIEKFLGRKQSIQQFLKKIGINDKNTSVTSSS